MKCWCLLICHATLSSNWYLKHKICHYLKQNSHNFYFQAIFFAVLIYGLRVLRVCYGPLPSFLCNIAGFLNGCALLFVAITIAMYTFTRFMFVCIWKRMRQMDDNLIVRIVTIQTVVMSLFFTGATWLQLQSLPTILVSFFAVQVCLRQPS